MSTSEAATPSRWIRSARFDLSLVFGGAALALALPVLAMASPALLVPLFFWAWVFFFEGSHFWATYSRTYLDQAFRRQNAAVLSGSLLFFLLPALAVVTDLAVYYGFFIFLWSLVHNTRQHYGFVAIYSRKAGLDAVAMQRMRWGTYLATVGPMAHFAVAFKLGGDFPGVAQALHGQPALFAALATWLPWSLTGLSVAYAAWLMLQYKRNVIAVAYLATCVIFYNAMFFLVAHREPFLPSPRFAAESMMIVTLMNSLFHNIQYHAIVWHFSDKRYATEGAVSQPGLFGLAQKINAKLSTYVLAALGFSVLFTAVFYLRGDLELFGLARSTALPKLAYVLYFGVVGHHFYLDQKIWRVSKGPELSKYFALTPHATNA